MCAKNGCGAVLFGLATYVIYLQLEATEAFVRLRVDCSNIGICKPRFLFEPSAGICDWPKNIKKGKLLGTVLRSNSDPPEGLLGCFKDCLKEANCSAINWSPSACELLGPSEKPFSETISTNAADAHFVTVSRPHCYSAGTESDGSQTEIRCSWNDGYRGVYFTGVVLRSYDTVESVRMCIMLCEIRADCSSVNWHSVENRCDLMRDQASTVNQFSSLVANFTNIYASKFHCVESGQSLNAPQRNVSGPPYSDEVERAPADTTSSKLGTCKWGIPFLATKFLATPLRRQRGVQNRQECAQLCGDDEACASANWSPQWSACELNRDAVTEANQRTNLMPTGAICANCSYFEKRRCVL